MSIQILTEEYLARRDVISELNKQLTAAKEEQKLCEQEMLELLSQLGVPRIGTKSANIIVTQKKIPNVADWDKFYSYIKDNDAMYLLQRRIATTAANELLGLGEEIPGVDIFETETLSVRRVAPTS